MKKIAFILIACNVALLELKGQAALYTTPYILSSFSENCAWNSSLQAVLPNFYYNANKNVNLLRADTACVSKMDSATLDRYSYHWIFYYDFFTTLTAMHTVNSTSINEEDNLYLYYNLDMKSNLEFRKVKWDLYLFNDYGLRHFFDSITTKTQDQFTFKNQFYYPIYKSKIFVALAANTQTQLFNSHRYRTDTNGVPERFLYDGFMSPGVIVYSGGLTYEAGGNAILHLGLGSSKVTKVKNQKIFNTRNEDIISGIHKGERKKSEWGLTVTATVPLQHLNKQLHWEFYENIFVPLQGINEIKNYTLELNNVIHLLLLKYVRLSLRTKLSYNFELNPKPVLQNQLSLGFYLSNHL